MTERINNPDKGTFLIAEPFMLDPNFRRSVVLLTEHGEDGSVGFILNKPTNMSLNEAVPDFPEFEATLYLGGPVQPETLHFIHRIEALQDSSMTIRDGLYWGGDFDQLQDLIRRGAVEQDDIRFFLGYSGWGASQLTSEMKQKSWIVSNEMERFTFSVDPTNLWRSILQSMGRKYKIISNYPPDPSLN